MSLDFVFTCKALVKGVPQKNIGFDNSWLSMRRYGIVSPEDGQPREGNSLILHIDLKISE